MKNKNIRKSSSHHCDDDIIRVTLLNFQSEIFNYTHFCNFFNFSNFIRQTFLLFVMPPSKHNAKFESKILRLNKPYFF